MNEMHTLSVHQKVLSREQYRQKFVEAGWLVSVPFNVVPAHWLYGGEQRLDGGYYTKEAIAALRMVNDCGFEVKPLEQLVNEIFVLDRFRRIYANDRKSGWPYLSASEALEFRPFSDRWIAQNHAPKQAKRHFAKEGWILVSSSGSVGRMVLVTTRLEKYFLTHDLIRILPKRSPPRGYLYAFLSTWIGRALISKDQYGSAIKHLEPHHLSGVPVPLLPDQEQQAIHDEILRASALREEANKLLDDANEQLYKELDLPHFDESAVMYLPSPPHLQTNRPEMPHPKAFSVKAIQFDERLDASYHMPIARTVIEILHKGKYKPVHLGKLAESIRLPPRFKRIYVQKEYGIPFLRPSHLPQIRLHDLGYISRLTNVLDSLLLNKGDVLITTDGTVGRISLVTSQIAGWAGSNNIARITYGTQNFTNGYMAAFLSTPYGFHQLAREIFGGVIDHIEESQIESVLIPNPPKEIQIAIGELIVNAFEKKDEARKIEESAIKKLEEILQLKNKW